MKKQTQTHDKYPYNLPPWWQYPNGLMYRRACEYMGIDPDNNPNYADVKKQMESKS